MSNKNRASSLAASFISVSPDSQYIFISYAHQYGVYNTQSHQYCSTATDSRHTQHKSVNVLDDETNNDVDTANTEHQITTNNIDTLNIVRSAAYSRDSRILVVGTDHKQLLLYVRSTSDNNQWMLHDTLVLSKKITYSVIDSDHTLLCADKTGDVYSINITTQQNTTATDTDTTTSTISDKKYSLSNVKVIMGHLAIITYIQLTDSAPRYVLSGDSEGKLRISHYPHTYDIHYMCLGTGTSYTDMCVLCSVLVYKDEYVVTGGIGNSLYVFNVTDGTLVNTVNTTQNTDINTNTTDQQFTEYVSCISYNNKLNILAVSIFPHHTIQLYSVHESQLTLIQSINLSSITNSIAFNTVNHSIYCTTNGAVHCIEYSHNDQQYVLLNDNQLSLQQQYIQWVESTRSIDSDQFISLSGEIFKRLHTAVVRRHKLSHIKATKHNK